MKTNHIKMITDSLQKIARPLEIARMNHLLFSGKKEAIIKALETYQNEDGGFGHGLEPDFINPHSSATQTWVATNIIKDHAIDPFEPIVEKLMVYLTNTFDEKLNRWHAINDRNHLYPHAPWWEKEGSLTSMNPSASLAGFIISYGNPMEKLYKYAKSVVDEALHMIINPDLIIERHELSCLIEMLDDIQTFYLKDPNYIKAKNRMILRMDEVIEKNEDLWFTSYVTKPSDLIKKHPSFGSEVYFELLLKEVDLAFIHQNEHHLWNMTWEWSDFEEAFEQAKKAWQGIIAYDYLKLMKDLGLILK